MKKEKTMEEQSARVDTHPPFKDHTYPRCATGQALERLCLATDAPLAKTEEISYSQLHSSA